MKSLENSHLPNLPIILFYSEKKGPLHKVSPWTKFLGLVLFVAAATIVYNTYLLIGLYLLSLSLYLSGRFPLGKLLRWSVFPAFFTLTVSLLIIFSQPGKPTIIIPGWLTVTDAGIFLLLRFLLKTLATVNYSFTFIMSTKYSEISSLVNKLLPSPFDVMFLLSYHFVFLIFEVIETSLKAAWSRGASLRRSLTSVSLLYAKVFSTAIVHSFDRAERVGKAMEARGFSGELKTYEPIKHPSLQGWLILLLSASALFLVYFYQGVIP